MNNQFLFTSLVNFVSSRTGGSSRWPKVLPIMGIKRPRLGHLVMRLNLNPWIHDDYKNGPVNSL